jgi:hypothetical protein
MSETTPTPMSAADARAALDRLLGRRVRATVTRGRGCSAQIITGVLAAEGVLFVARDATVRYPDADVHIDHMRLVSVSEADPASSAVMERRYAEVREEADCLAQELDAAQARIRELEGRFAATPATATLRARILATVREVLAQPHHEDYRAGAITTGVMAKVRPLLNERDARIAGQDADIARLQALADRRWLAWHSARRGRAQATAGVDYLLQEVETAMAAVGQQAAARTRPAAPATEEARRG